MQLQLNNVLVASASVVASMLLMGGNTSTAIAQDSTQVMKKQGLRGEVQTMEDDTDMVMVSVEGHDEDGRSFCSSRSGNSSKSGSSKSSKKSGSSKSSKKSGSSGYGSGSSNGSGHRHPHSNRRRLAMKPTHKADGSLRLTADVLRQLEETTGLEKFYEKPSAPKSNASKSSGSKKSSKSSKNSSKSSKNSSKSSKNSSKSSKNSSNSSHSNSNSSGYGSGSSNGGGRRHGGRRHGGRRHGGKRNGGRHGGRRNGGHKWAPRHLTAVDGSMQLTSGALRQLEATEANEYRPPMSDNGSSRSGSSKGSKSSKNSSKSGSSKSSKSSKNSSKSGSSKSSKSSKNSSKSGSGKSSNSSRCVPRPTPKPNTCNKSSVPIRCLRPSAKARFGNSSVIPFDTLVSLGKDSRLRKLQLPRHLLDVSAHKINKRVNNFFFEVFEREQAIKATCVSAGSKIITETYQEGTSAHLKCAKNQTVKIVRATYGSATCPSSLYTTEAAQASCGEHQNQCTIYANDHTFQNTCALNNYGKKQLQIQYQCLAPNSTGRRNLNRSVKVGVFARNGQGCKGKEKCSIDIQCTRH